MLRAGSSQWTLEAEGPGDPSTINHTHKEGTEEEMVCCKSCTFPAVREEGGGWLTLTAAGHPWRGLGPSLSPLHRLLEAQLAAGRDDG